MMQDSYRAMLHAQYSQADLLRVKPPDQFVPTTAAILTYEVGDFVKCAMNVHWGGVRDYHGEAKVALADVITMCRLLSALLGIDFWDALRKGEDRYMDAASIRETRRDGYAKNE